MISQDGAWVLTPTAHCEDCGKQMKAIPSCFKKDQWSCTCARATPPARQWDYESSLINRY